jgi:hypothetical protein
MLRWLRRLLTLALVLVLIWVVALAIAGELGSRWLALRAQTTMASALGARVRLGGVDVGLVRGHFELAELDLERKALGAMRLQVHHAELESAPLGLALLDLSHAERLRVRGVRLELSSWAALAPPPDQRRQLRVDAVELSDVAIVLAPTLLLPNLGAVTVTIDTASAGAVELRSAVSWLLQLHQLKAHASWPGGGAATVAFRSKADKDGTRTGTLTISTTLLRGDLSLPVTLPSPATIRAEGEVAALRRLGGELARQVALRKARQAAEGLLR